MARTKKESLSLSERPEYQELANLLGEPGPKDLVWHYRVGKRVEILCPDKSRQYGTGGFSELADELGQPEYVANLFWAKRKFYNEYRYSDVQDLSKPREDSEFVLSWSHINVLLPLEKKDRKKLQGRCIKGCWSSNELQRRIKETKTMRGHGGVRLRKPEKEEDNLRQLIAESEMWQRRFQKIWFPKAGGGICLDVKKAESEELGELREKAATILGEIQSGIEECLANQKRQAGKSKKKAGDRVRKSR